MTATLLKIAGMLAGGYLALVALMALTQTATLFPRWAVTPPPPLPPEAETLRIRRPGGVELHGLRLPARPEAGAPAAEGTGAPPVLGFGGNAWNAADMALFLQRHLPGHDILAFHYRGYPPSTGRPSAAALAEDALAIHDHLAAQGLPAPVVVGFSIGTGPAATLAAERPTAGAILVTPFDSLTELARAHYPWAPVRLLLRHRMEPAADLRRAGVPIALIAAARDGIVPPARTEALRRALADPAPDPAPGIVFDRTLPAGHNDLYAHPDFGPALRAAMDSLRAAD